MIEPLRVDLEVACSPEHAFRTWTEHFAAWWPPGHSVSGDPVAIVFEPHVGGRIYERTATGTEVEWGEVTVFEPPHRLAYLWHIRRDRADATDVDVRFAAVAPGRTRLGITHTGWERLGADAERWRDATQGGWAGLLPHYRAAIDSLRSDTPQEGTP